MVCATSQPRSPQETGKRIPGLEMAHAIPSFLLFFKEPWQHLSLCRQMGEMRWSWIKHQPVRAACSTWMQADGAGLGWRCPSACGHHVLKTTCTLLTVSMRLVWLSPWWCVNCEEHLKYTELSFIHWSLWSRQCHLKVTQSITSTSLLTGCTSPTWPWNAYLRNKQTKTPSESGWL